MRFKYQTQSGFSFASVVAGYEEPLGRTEHYGEQGFGRTEHDGELEVIEIYALVGMQNISPIV